MKYLPLLACLLLASASEAQERPFTFTVATRDGGVSPEAPNWTVYYDSGYGEPADLAFGYDGLEQRFGVQGRPGSGLTFVGHVGLGLGDGAARSTQQAELLKDFLNPTSRLRLALGVGARREREGTAAGLARLCLGWDGGGALLFGNLLVERPLAAPARDSVDVITTLGWLQEVGGGFRLGVEAVGEDLEGFWEADEAEGGAKLYAGAALNWTAPAGRLWFSAGGGPVVYATRSPPSSAAPRPLGANGNGFTLRLSVGYAF